MIILNYRKMKRPITNFKHTRLVTVTRTKRLSVWPNIRRDLWKVFLKWLFAHSVLFFLIPLWRSTQLGPIPHPEVITTARSNARGHLRSNTSLQSFHQTVTFNVIALMLLQVRALDALFQAMASYRSKQFLEFERINDFSSVHIWLLVPLVTQRPFIFSEQTYLKWTLQNLFQTAQLRVLLERVHPFSRHKTIGWNQNFEIRCDNPEDLFSGLVTQ